MFPHLLFQDGLALGFPLESMCPSASAGQRCFASLVVVVVVGLPKWISSSSSSFPPSLSSAASGHVK